MPESHQKKRRRLSRSSTDILLAALSDFAGRRSDVLIAAELASNEPVISVTLTSPLEPRPLLELSNELLRLITATAAEVNLASGWSLGFYQDGDLIKALGPTSEPESLCSVCGLAQYTSFGPTCLFCRSPVEG